MKSTYGTGCFALLNTGAEKVTSRNRLLTTIAYRLGGQTTYALEGSIFVAGAVVQWLRDGLQIIGQAAETQGLADLSDPAACAALIGGCDAVINAAAWTAVDKAEAEEAAATVVNGDAPAAMARACAALGLPFLHISTDYVFDGAGEQPFAVDDPVAPLGAYGRSKLAGERGVLAAGGNVLILRTSWVVSAHGTNFVKTMLRLGAERESLNVVADQIGGPTPAAAIADALYVAARAMAGGAPGGVHHFAGQPETSWAGFAREIM
ncbi:MAG: sugar nucleotide-binding protein, partial [Brevundimonas sp.]|uniref:SDR family oxidoreductase n=1 Tax=Brevundimonas sp. TaxID=1871086 RepID=UPI00273230CC